MRAKDLMVKDFQSIDEDTSLLEAVKLLRERPLVTGKVDVRCLVVVDKANEPLHLLTEADVVRAILPTFFREKKFSEHVARWLTKGIPQATLDELWRELSARARKKTVASVMADSPLVSVDEEESLLKVAYIMHLERIKSLPVTRDGKVTGIVYRAAVFETVADEIMKAKPSAAAR